MKTNRTEINLIVYEYLKEELKNKGLQWPLDNKPNLNENELNLSSKKRKQIIDVLSNLSHSISTTFNDNLNQMCLNIEANLNENLSNLVELDYESFREVADELFSDGFKWVHIICLLLFSTKLIIFKINDCRIAEFTMNICNYLTMFLSQHLLTWINDHGAWTGLLEYFDNINYGSKPNSITNKLSWSSTSLNKFDATIGFLGFALGFGIFLFNKN